MYYLALVKSRLFVTFSIHRQLVAQKYLYTTYMNGIDILLQQAIIAAFVWVVLATYAQQKWRLFSTFFGKKYGPVVAVALYSLAWVQCLIVAIITFKSTWSITPAIPLGIVCFMGAFYLFYNQKSTPFALHIKRSFKKILRLHAPFVLLLLGIGFSSGQLGLQLAAATYAICGLVHAAILSRLAK